MADTIGRISVPTPAASGLTFPLTPDMGYGFARDWTVITHRFGDLATRANQRFQVGVGPRKFSFRRERLSRSDRVRLFDFFEQVEGSFKSFTYNAPKSDRVTTEAVQVIFDTQPLTVEDFATWCKAGITLVEAFDPASAPVYPISDTCLRFPSTDLNAALLKQEQIIVPLIHIELRDQALSTQQRNIYLSDRRCTIGSQVYLPRIIGLGERGGDVIISQDIKGSADGVQFTFGNADRVMTQLSNDTDLKYASIDFSLYHVNSGILLQLWKGFVQSFVADGSPQFTMSCSDGLFQTMLQYPNRTISRDCWKTFDDGLNCPYASKGSGGDPTSCDYFFDTPNGCHAHGMDAYFGGHPLAPQAVRVKDNTTGFAGWQRNVVTATSIANDTMWEKPLPEIWCNDGGDPLKAFIANAVVATTRDEGDFRDLLGIVGAGPLGKFSVNDPFSAFGVTGKLAQNADGQFVEVNPVADEFPAHSWRVDGNFKVIPPDKPYQASWGLRQVHGHDPVTDEPANSSLSVKDDTNDVAQTAFALGQSANGAPSTYGATPYPQAAGTAFVELRYQKPSGFQPSTAEEHSMQIPISMGLSGRVWDSSGGATWVDGLTNPFWVAINSYLRAIGMPPRVDDDAETIAAQLASFVLPSLNAGDGSGTAEIADNIVEKLVDVGTETQFQFQGTLAELKPFRDWLTEILATGLGYFIWEFGKLKFGIRENASAVSAFTLGNILYQSLHLEPIDAAFERLTIEFADQAFQYKANTARYTDKDHAKAYGRQNAPLSARQHSVGCPTVSQGLRMAAVRTREETGGVTADEWRAARRGGWKSTILALETEAGQVVSLTHPDVPGGFQHFRILKWRLLKDWSIDFDVQTVTASMYDLEVGPKPADVSPQPLPVLFYPEPLGVWAPNYVQADESDAIAPAEWTFELSQAYITLADQVTSIAELTARGKFPVDQFIPGCGAPLITEGTLDLGSGSIPAGTKVRVSVCAMDANGDLSPPSNIAIVKIPDTGPGGFTIHDIQWPVIDGLTEYVLFASDHDDLICAQATGVLGGSVAGYSPTSIAFSGTLARSTWALPNPRSKLVRLKGKRLIHGGVQGSEVDSVSGTSVVCGESVDFAGTDNWTGRKLILIGRNDGTPAPFVAFNITAFDPSTGAFTLDRSADGILQQHDAVVVSMEFADNSANPTRVTDPGLANSQDATAHQGLVPSWEKGYKFRVLYGKSRGKSANIIDNDATSYTLDTPIGVDASSLCIVEEKAWQWIVDSSTLKNFASNFVGALTLPTANFQKESILLGGFTVDTDGNESPEDDAPFRMLFVYGTPASFRLTDKVTFGLDDDIEGTNKVGKFGNVHFEGKPFIGSVSCVSPPILGNMILDALFSPDNGDTWISAFPSGDSNKIVYKPGDKGLKFLLTFADVTLEPGYIWRIDSVQSGGASGIEVVIKSGEPLDPAQAGGAGTASASSPNTTGFVPATL